MFTVIKPSYCPPGRKSYRDAVTSPVSIASVIPVEQVPEVAILPSSIRTTPTTNTHTPQNPPWRPAVHRFSRTLHWMLL